MPAPFATSLTDPHDEHLSPARPASSCMHARRITGLRLLPPHPGRRRIGWPMKKPITIATLYRRGPLGDLPLLNMAFVRWLRISQHLARLGFDVDVIATTSSQPAQPTEHLRFVPSSQFRPDDYDVIKALFHRGFETLAAAGGAEHPFIISKLGSVVGGTDGTPGVHFLGEERRSLYEIQQQIYSQSRYVTVLTEPSKELWEREFGRRDNVLLVPTGVDSHIPPPNANPYREFGERIAVYIGNLYDEMQKHINLLWQRRLNALGRLLKSKGIRLCVIGPGHTEELDPSAVTYLAAVGNDQIWDYHYFADVGIVLAQGEVQHNESSKLYYYLRSGLPVVSESSVPNNHLIEESGLGLIANYGDDQMMAELIEQAARTEWPREAAIAHMLEHHTWERRARVYSEIIHATLGD
jgi:glycosyltransferase involved in cell wall biosynthesis